MANRVHIADTSWADDRVLTQHGSLDAAHRGDDRDVRLVMVCERERKDDCKLLASQNLSECAWVKVQHHALTRLRLANRYAVQSRDGASSNWSPAGL